MLTFKIHNINTRFGFDLHTPTANLTTFQKKGPFYFGITVFNHLPTSIKNTSHDKPIQIFFNIQIFFIITNLIHKFLVHSHKLH